MGASVGLGSGSEEHEETSRALLKGRKVGGWAWALGAHLPRPPIYAMAPWPPSDTSSPSQLDRHRHR
jgi:hypothetical protein